MMSFRQVAAFFALLAVSFLRLPPARACAVCLGSADGSVADAYNWSVLFLMATPYLVVGSIAGYLVYAYRRGAAVKAQKVTAEEAPIQLALNQKESGR